MKTSDAVTALSALAHDTRLTLFRALVVAGRDGMTPSQFVEALQIPNATLSFHLKELQHAELIAVERQGRHLIYRANFDAMTHLLQFLTERCCQGMVCAVQSVNLNPCIAPHELPTLSGIDHPTSPTCSVNGIQT